MAPTHDRAKIVFMGTPQFAVPSLRALASGPYDIAVVTQPDKPAGRGGKLTPPAVKIAAEHLGLPVLQPPTLRDESFRSDLRALAPDVTVLVAYGEYVAPSLLDLPRRGSVNLHPSLLPRWRGSTPIQSAILAGDEVTGVTIILMDKGLDTGPILAQREVRIEAEETHPELAARLAEAGAELLSETLPGWLRGEITPIPEDDGRATLTRTLQKSDGLLDWKMSAEEIARRVRALQPWPGTYTYWEGKMLKVLHARITERPTGATAEPGSVVVTDAQGAKQVVVACGVGTLELLELQLEGKSPVPAQDLVRGYPRLIGSRFSSEGLT